MARKTLGTLVVENIKNNIYWNDVHEVIKRTKPLYRLLKICDGERHRVGEIYEGMDNILGKVKDIIDDGKYNGEFTNMVNIMVSRWDKMTIPLHCLGFAFTHCFYDHAYLNAPALGGYVRRAPI